MDTALNKTLASLPDDTVVYPGHEYTKANANFAVSILKDEFTMKLHAFAEKNEETQGKFTIGDEKAGHPHKCLIYMYINESLLTFSQRNTMSL